MRDVVVFETDDDYYDWATINCDECDVLSSSKEGRCWLLYRLLHNLPLSELDAVYINADDIYDPRCLLFEPKEDSDFPRGSIGYYSLKRSELKKLEQWKGAVGNEKD